MQLNLRLLPDRLSVCRLPAGSGLPDWALSGNFCSVTWTDEETSVVSAESTVPAGVESEQGWRALTVVGPLDFGMTGILASLTRSLADARISIFAVSTFDTDYILVRDSMLDRAIQALAVCGHRVS